MAHVRIFLTVTSIVSMQWVSYQIQKIARAHAPGMPGTFSPSPQVSDPDMHHGTCDTHVPWCKSGSLTSGFLWNRRRGETFPAFAAHAHPQFCVSGKRPMRGWYHDFSWSLRRNHNRHFDLTGKLSHICSEHLEENWPSYITGTAQYATYHPSVYLNTHCIGMLVLLLYVI